MCGGACPQTDSAVAGIRLKISILTLMLVVSGFLFMNIFHHTLSLTSLGYALVYIIVLNIGMRGAATRNINLLRFYWVFQLVQVIVFLLSILVCIGFVTYFHIAHPHPIDTMPTKPQVVVADVKNTDVNANIHHNTVVVKTVEQTHEVLDEQKTAPRAVVVHTYTLAGLLVPAAIVLVVFFMVTRSIVLARQLIALIEIENAAGVADVELSQCCQEEEPVQTSQEPVYTPEAVYVMPVYVAQDNAAYPGQLMPVYVDKFGQTQ